jgi:hypothetical protein
MDWIDYEKEVEKACSIAFPDALINRNVKIIGRYSKRSRQIDILIEEKIGGETQRIIIDCKLYNKKVNIKEVESFISMVEDIGNSKGILITEKGYSKSAIKRAYNNPSYIELDIFSLKELKKYQGEHAISFSGKHGVILFAPFGWIIDNTPFTGAICTLYQKGLTLKEAGFEKEWAYVNFWIKKDEKLTDLLQAQEMDMRQHLKVNAIEHISTIKRDDANTIIRIADIEEYPGLELTAFAEFSEFIFFCVFHVKRELILRNTRKAESILRSIIPVKIKME